MIRTLFLRGILMLLPVALLAQEDTIRVQTLTFDSITTRRGFWQFPDDSHTYRKVLMRYTLKCDAATTHDQYACGEWDYLTYNYLYDHTGVIDSTELDHPYFLLNTQAPDSVAMSSDPLVDLYQRWSRFRVIDQISLETDHVVGLGNAFDANTLGTSLGAVRSQFIYTAAELSAAGLQAGPIDQLRFNVAGGGTSPHRMVLRMKNTTSPLVDRFDETGLQQVYDHQYLFANNGVSTVVLSEAFAWDGTSDILVDMALERTSALGGPTLTATNTGTPTGLRMQGRDGVLLLDNDRIGVDVDGLTTLDEEITITFRAFGSAVQPVNNSILEGVNANGQRVLNIHLPWSNGSVYWDAGSDGGSYDRIDKAANPADYEGQWNHWAFTKNTATGSMKIYLNGTLWHSGTAKTRSMAGITAFNLGANGVGTNPYPGMIDAFTLFTAELDAATIAAWKDRNVDASHPNYADLRYDIRFDQAPDEPTFLNTVDPARPAVPFGTPERRYLPATAIAAAPVATTTRPDIALVQGTYVTHMDSLLLTDEVPHAMLSLQTFQVVGNGVEPLDTLTGWNGPYTYTYAPNGQAIDSTLQATVLENNYDLLYYSAPFEVIDRYELGRFITPYGIGLSLGPSGFTWTYDVTDYQWLLHDSVELSAGNQQELIDLEFLLIEGQPPREVVALQRPWGPQRSYSYASLSDDTELAPVTVDLDPAASQWAVRTRFTGHGHASNNGLYPHCCEWKDNTHSLFVDGTLADEWHIWQTDDCALNPVFPQGGTWPGSREGWCPGDVVKDHFTEITGQVSGNSVTLDYGITPVPANNLGMGSGNYVVNVDLFEYAAPAHALDAEIYLVKRPTTADYHSRENPICQDPVVVLRNAGAQDLTSATFTYGVSGGQTATHTWTGLLKHMESTEVTLNVPDGSFWYGDGTDRFTVTVSAPNGGNDTHPQNDSYTTEFDLPVIYPESIVLYYKTNNYPQQNSIFIRNMWGTVMHSRTNMTANTIYSDTLTLPQGCYTLEVTDSGNDGLSYWANTAQGSGFIRFRQVGGGTLKNFQPEFGHSIHWAFGVGDIVGIEEEAAPIAITAFPNPNNGSFTLGTSDLQGTGLLRITDALGRVVREERLQLFGAGFHAIDMGHAKAGIYQVHLLVEGRVATTRVSIE